MMYMTWFTLNELVHSTTDNFSAFTEITYPVNHVHHSTQYKSTLGVNTLIYSNYFRCTCKKDTRGISIKRVGLWYNIYDIILYLNIMA